MQEPKIPRIYKGKEMPSNDIIVIGIGGGGCNAIDNMMESQKDRDGVDFVGINTDVNHLNSIRADYRFQIGDDDGLGTGANPALGEEAARKAEKLIREIIKSAKLVLITSGFGKGTGTGATPIIAGIAKEEKKLVVCVITVPFFFEGLRAKKNSEIGIENLKHSCDAYIVVSNEMIFEIAKHNSTIVTTLNGFNYANDVLNQCIIGISNIMLHNQMFNIDFKDLCTCLSNQGRTYFGIGYGKGDNCAVEAVRKAKSIVLQNRAIDNAKSMLIQISVKRSVNINLINDAVQMASEGADSNKELIFGMSYLEESNPNDMIITIICCGFDNYQMPVEPQQVEKIEVLPERSPSMSINPNIVKVSGDDSPLWTRFNPDDKK